MLLLLYIIRFDDVLFCLRCFFWCPRMAIHVSVHYNGVGFSPILYCTVDPMLLPQENPFECHEEFFFYLQPMILPKRFDFFSPC